MIGCRVVFQVQFSGLPQDTAPDCGTVFLHRRPSTLTYIFVLFKAGSNASQASLLQNSSRACACRWCLARPPRNRASCRSPLCAQLLHSQRVLTCLGIARQQARAHYSAVPLVDYHTLHVPPVHVSKIRTYKVAHPLHDNRRQLWPRKVVDKVHAKAYSFITCGI